MGLNDVFIAWKLLHFQIDFHIKFDINFHNDFHIDFKYKKLT